MYYTDEDVDALEARLTIPGGDAYVKQTALAVGKMLEGKKELYKTFGVYWWAMKKALKKYYPGDAWFKGKYFDQLMFERSWHKSMFRTILAAAYYHEQHMSIASAHDWTDASGEEQQYTLLDDDAGF